VQEKAPAIARGERVKREVSLSHFPTRGEEEK